MGRRYRQRHIELDSNRLHFAESNANSYADANTYADTNADPHPGRLSQCVNCQ